MGHNYAVFKQSALIGNKEYRVEVTLSPKKVSLYARDALSKEAFSLQLARKEADAIAKGDYRRLVDLLRVQDNELVLVAQVEEPAD